MDERSEDLALQAFLFTVASDFFLHVMSYHMGPLVLFPSEGRCVAPVIALTNVHLCSYFWFFSK
jgi:hypothetical protein